MTIDTRCGRARRRGRCSGATPGEGWRCSTCWSPRPDQNREPAVERATSSMERPLTFTVRSLIASGHGCRRSHRLGRGWRCSTWCSSPWPNTNSRPPHSPSCCCIDGRPGGCLGGGRARRVERVRPRRRSRRCAPRRSGQPGAEPEADDRAAGLGHPRTSAGIRAMGHPWARWHRSRRRSSAGRSMVPRRCPNASRPPLAPMSTQPSALRYVGGRPGRGHRSDLRDRSHCRMARARARGSR